MNSDQHEERAWSVIAATLGISSDDAATQLEIGAAADIWRNFNIDNFATSVDLVDDLKQMAFISRRLASKSERVRKHVQMQMLLQLNGMTFFDDDPDNPFADVHLQAIRSIGDLCDLLAATMKTTRGPKGNLPRRAAWLRATEIYEQKTGKKAAVSRNAAQQICGPWVEFIRAFCTYVIANYVPEAGAIEAFHKQRARTLKEGGNPLVEVFLGG
jgi:hypothetical protein